MAFNKTKKKLTQEDWISYENVVQTKKRNYSHRIYEA